MKIFLSLIPGNLILWIKTVLDLHPHEFLSLYERNDESQIEKPNDYKGEHNYEGHHNKFTVDTVFELVIQKVLLILC